MPRKQCQMDLALSEPGAFHMEYGDSDNGMETSTWAATKALEAVTFQDLATALAIVHP